MAPVPAARDPVHHRGEGLPGPQPHEQAAMRRAPARLGPRAV